MLPASSRAPVQTTAAYTDLNSLQKIKAEGDKDVALHKVAKQFESMFVSLLFKGMRQANAVFEEGNIGTQTAEVDHSKGAYVDLVRHTSEVVGALIVVG